LLNHVLIVYILLQNIYSRKFFTAYTLHSATFCTVHYITKTSYKLKIYTII